MIKDFLLGATFVAKGWHIFYRDKKLWRYAAIPFFIMLCFYSVIIFAIFYATGAAAKYFSEEMSQLPGWVSWAGGVVSCVLIFLGIVVALIFVSATVCTLYEFFGGLFFDSFIGYYEEANFQIAPRKMSLGENLKYGWDSFGFGLHTVLIFGFLSVASLLIPFVGQAILVIVMGYYYGVSYLIPSANNSHVSIRQLKCLCFRKAALIAGFGVTAYLLLAIPFLAIFLLPGFVVGGSELFNTQLKREA